MPTSVGVSALALAAITTAVSAPVALAIAVLAFFWEVWVFYKAGSDI